MRAIFLIGASALCLALMGCGKSNTNVKIASQIAMTQLRSPSSFSLISGEEVWKGQSRAGDPAYLVRLEFDSQNGFGTMIRACKIVAFSVKSGGQFEYTPGRALDDCEVPGVLDQAAVIGIITRINDFKEKSK